MHIGIVTETYPPEVNGVSLTLAFLAQSLTRLGHRVSVVRPWRKDLKNESNGVEVVPVPGAPLPRYPGLRFGLPVTRRLKALWRRQRPDALYLATEGPLGWAALKGARELGIPAFSGYHTRFEQYMDHYRLGLARNWVARYLRHFHNRSLGTLVPTQALRDELQTSGYQNLVLFRRGLDTRFFNPQHRDLSLRRGWGVDADTPVVISVGRIAPEKNLDLALRAFQAFREEQPDARYLWVGDGPARRHLQHQHPEFIFTGMLRGEELARHYASADVFLFPSVTETFGNVTLEALASGLAVVAFDYGAAREHVTSGTDGCLAPFGNEEQFIALARHLGRHPESRRQLSRNAPRAVAHLSYEQVAQAFVGILRRQIPQEAA